MLFSKVFRGITLSGALLFAAGCGLFDNSTPTEDLYPVPQAEMDPGFNPDDFGNGTFGPGGAGNPETPSPDWGEPTEEGMAYIGMEDLSVLTDINFPVIYFNFDAGSTKCRSAASSRSSPGGCTANRRYHTAAHNQCCRGRPV